VSFPFPERWGEREHAPNPLSEAVARRRATGAPLLDLTVTNPTRCGLAYPAGWENLLAGPGVRVYDPDPRGGEAARAAVAAYYAERDGRPADPESLFLTAGTSEGYSHLFRLLCGPGDEVLVPRPSYPLLETLAELGDVTLRPYDLLPGRADFARGTPWALDRAGLEAAAGPRTRALVIVNPNNPTGSRLSDGDAAHLLEFAGRRRLALIVDEVFADSLRAPASPFPASAGPPVFTLNGLSKSLALPQLKLAWIRVEGNPEDTRRARETLEWMCDAYLSVSTASQLACAALLPRRAEFAGPLRARIEANLETLRGLAAGRPRLRPLWPEGGWCLPVRCEGIGDDEAFAIRLVREEGVLAQPGYFFDFDDEETLVLGLLTEPDVFREGAARLARALG
jgi:aspartate/methionine/tyrosine aminotransferase